MCGIAGVAGCVDRQAAEKSVRTMVQALERRGPDGAGVESWDGAVLGHRRLAIFDLSEAGRQPMVSPDGSIGVVFNGAIYNYRELRQELLDQGYAFKSRTDTEVLVHGYRAWGLDSLVVRLRGMFAFALWDQPRGKLYLVRDRLGVKPLVYTVRNQIIAFASTIRALRVARYVHDLDEKAVVEFLRFGFITDRRSIYRGAIKVPAASIVEWCNGAVVQRKYWVEPRAETSSVRSFREVVAATEERFVDAVKMRLHADVPVGALLSGGIDSGLICWAIKKLGGNVRAYTIGTPGDPWDETAAAIQTARALDIDHCVIEMSPAELPEIEDLISAYAEPFACASALGMLRVSQAIAPSAKVLLTGDGGDDVFLGYPEHRKLWLAQKLARLSPDLLKRCWLRSRAAVPRIGALRRAATFLDYSTVGFGAVAANGNGLPGYKNNKVLGARLANLSPDVRDSQRPADRGRQVLDDYLDFMRETYFVGEYLPKVDGATMHYGLEARSPFLDQVLWEFAASLPFNTRMHGGVLKSVLRKLAGEKIGGFVARRRKQGFGIPVQRWITNRWRPMVEQVLRESVLDKEGWICAPAVLEQLKLAVRQGWAPQQLWYIFVFESWMRREKLLAA